MASLRPPKLNEKAPELAYPKPTEAERVRFASRPAVQAIKRLEQVGYGNKAAALYTSFRKNSTVWENSPCSP